MPVFVCALMTQVVKEDKIKKMSIKYSENNLPYIQLECGYKICLEYEEIEDEKYKEKAEKELRDTPEIRQQALIEIKELMKSEYIY